jgi:hypothetical protein
MSSAAFEVAVLDRLNFVNRSPVLSARGAYVDYKAAEDGVPQHYALKPGGKESDVECRIYECMSAV